MDQPTNHESHQPLQREPADRPSGITLRLPKPNWQVTALLLIAIIAALQTVQLVRLKGNLTPKATAATTAAASTSGSSLPSQVGGC